MTTLFEKEAPHPLADRLRPHRLADIVGQDHLLGPEGPIWRMMASRQLASMILWGPPGCGKTTIARLLAHGTDLVFEPLSAVFSGVADLRKVFEAAKKRRAMGQGTLLFVDEIHRFNRAQQDAFLPVVEDGTVILIGRSVFARRNSTSRTSTGPRRRIGPTTRGTDVALPERPMIEPGLSTSTPSSAVAKRLE